MSAKHPIIAVTYSSGAGTTTTSEAFRKMFNMMNANLLGLKVPVSIATHDLRWTLRSARLAIKADIILVTLDRKQMTLLVSKSLCKYGQEGVGQIRRYLHTFDEWFLSTKRLEPLHHGKTYPKTLTSFFMKDCTVVLLTER